MVVIAPSATAVDRRHAGAHRLAVEMHRAGAAQRDAAAVLGAGQAEQIAQRPQQRHLRVGVDRIARPVDLQTQHGHPLWQQRWKSTWSPARRNPFAGAIRRYGSRIPPMRPAKTTSVRRCAASASLSRHRRLQAALAVVIAVGARKSVPPVEGRGRCVVVLDLEVQLACALGEGPAGQPCEDARCEASPAQPHLRAHGEDAGELALAHAQAGGGGLAVAPGEGEPVRPADARERLSPARRAGPRPSDRRTARSSPPGSPASAARSTDRARGRADRAPA